MAGTAFADNVYVQDLMTILRENGKDTGGLASLLDHVKTMEDFIRQSDRQMTVMKEQLLAIQEIQGHPIKAQMQSSVTALENAVRTIKEQWRRLKSAIVTGCKKMITAFKERGTAALDHAAAFFHVKDILQMVQRSCRTGAQEMDATMQKIADFAKEYHTAGMHVKNMARVAAGKETLQTPKEAGKLAGFISAPYRAQKTNFLRAENTIGSMIGKLEHLEISAAQIHSRNEQAGKDEQVSVRHTQEKMLRLEKPQLQEKPSLLRNLEEKKIQVNKAKLLLPDKSAKVQEASL
jgi:hypothetical protein